MPYRDLPTTKAGCLAALEAAQRKTVTTDPSAWLITAPQYTQYLNPETPPEGSAGSLLYRLRKELGEEATALAAQTPATSALESTRGLLRLTLSHFVQNLNNAILRGVLPRETRTTYQLPLETDRVPDLPDDDALRLWSGRLMDGEAERMAAPGAVAMAWPSAGEIETLRDQLNQRSAAQSSAKDRHDSEQKDVEMLMPAVLAAIKDMWDTIEFNLRHEPTNSSRRRRAREWGVYYALRPGEELPEGEEPAPSGANPTGTPPSNT